MSCCNIRDLVCMDDLERRDALLVALPAELLNSARVHVQPARLMHQVDNREPRAQRVRSHARGLPQRGMDG